MIQLYQTLDLRPIGIPQTLRLSQYDSDFEIIFELTNFDGTWILDTNTTAEVQGTKTDGHGYSADAVFDDQLKTVTIAGDVQMTAAAGRNVYEVVLFHDGDRLGSKNFILDVERAALDAETTASDSKIKNFTEMVEAAEDAAERAEEAASEFSTDTTLSIPGKAADAKATGDTIAAVDAETDKIASSKNLVKPDELVVGAITNGAGVINTSESFKTTGFIRVFANNPVTFSPKIKRLLAYTESKSAISSTFTDVTSASSYTYTPTQTGYVRVSFYTSDLSTAQAEYGNNATAYTPYQLTLNDVAFGQKQNTSVQNIFTGNLTADKNYKKHELLINATPELNSSYPNSVLSTVYANGTPHALQVENITGDSLTTVIDFTHSEAVSVVGMAYATLKLFVENANKLTSIRIIYRDSANKFLRDKTYTSFQEGYNEIRLESFVGIGEGFWENGIKSIRVFIVSSNGSKIRFYGLEGYYPEKAKICFIDDVGYLETLQNLYPALSALNIPTTWACQYGYLGSVQTGRGTRLSLSDLENLSTDSMSEFAFHTFNGGDSSTMTAKQAADDTLKSIRFMESHNLKPNKVYRGAWLSNRCTNPGISDTLVEASATPSGENKLCTFPFLNVRNIPRIALHGSGMTNAKFDEYFERLRLTHAILICYTHSVAPSVTDGVTVNEDYSMSAAQASYFVSKCTTGVNGGWLEGTTISRLLTAGEKTV